MKIKSVIFSVLLVAATAASAFELGINGGQRYAGSDRDTLGLSLAKKVGVAGAEFDYDQVRNNGIEQERYSVLGTYDVAKFGPIVVTAKGGGAFVDNRTGSDGYAFVVGAGVSYPLTKSVALTTDYRYQIGQSRINQYNGSTLNAGIKFAF